MAVHLVCEGFRGALDERVLDKLVVQFHSLNVLMQPSGGHGGFGPIRDFLKGRSSSDTAISIEDRDYRYPRAKAELTWANRAGEKFVWQRHKIENYLLEPRVVLALFDDYRAASGNSWTNALPATEGDVSALMQSLERFRLWCSGRTTARSQPNRQAKTLRKPRNRSSGSAP